MFNVIEIILYSAKKRTDCNSFKYTHILLALMTKEIHCTANIIYQQPI